MGKTYLLRFLTCPCFLLSSVPSATLSLRAHPKPLVRHKGSSQVSFDSAWRKKFEFRPDTLGGTSTFSRASFSTAESNDLDLPASDSSPRDLAFQAFSVLAKRNRSWRRLGHIVEMAIDNKENVSIKTAVDVGTDHGLLAVALSLSKNFTKVIGTDVSERALQDGAIELQDLVVNELIQRKQMPGNRIHLDFPLEFRLGDGLTPIGFGEADVVCLAGMGAHTMRNILLQSSSEGKSEIERVGCKKLLLQPTNSRPRTMMLLYQNLVESGWHLVDERIEELSARWYITSSFVRKELLDDIECAREQFPGCILMSLEKSSSIRTAFDEYVQHHKGWIEKDRNAYGYMHDLDTHWLSYVGRQIS